MNVHWDRVIIIHPLYYGTVKDQARMRPYSKQTLLVPAALLVSNLSSRLQHHFLSFLVKVMPKQHTSVHLVFLSTAVFTYINDLTLLGTELP